MAKKPYRIPRLNQLATLSWRDLIAALTPLLVILLIIVFALIWFIQPAPPKTITITAGPEGSSFHRNAERYRDILARNGLKLKILPSEGSLENLKRLNNDSFQVDVGFVQSGVATKGATEKLRSLGSISHQPLWVFHNSKKPINLLSQLNGKRVAIGEEGSGTRELTLTLLKANGIEPGGKTTLLDLDAEQAAQALIDQKIDAAFMMGDSATTQTMRKLTRSKNIQAVNFTQADAYTRRHTYLSEIILPMGAFDFGLNIPSQELHLIGPTVELVARENLHPALSDLLIEAAREVHSRATLMQKAGEFPAPIEHEFRISEAATRYYKSGKGFFYRNLPFWLASLMDRIVIIIVPIIILLIPAIKLLPAIYSWRIRSRIYRWYGALIEIERNAFSDNPNIENEKLQERLNQIEQAVNKMKMPLAFADQFYVLRQHIDFVREQLVSNGSKEMKPNK